MKKFGLLKQGRCQKCLLGGMLSILYLWLWSVLFFSLLHFDITYRTRPAPAYAIFECLHFGGVPRLVCFPGLMGLGLWIITYKLLIQLPLKMSWPLFPKCRFTSGPRKRINGNESLENILVRSSIGHWYRRKKKCFNPIFGVWKVIGL